MKRHIAFLRAINVGGHTVKMDRLRDLFAGMGFANVETFIASGNVIFDAPAPGTAALERKIETGLLTALGYRVDTFIRTPAELAAVAAKRPFGDADHAALRTWCAAHVGRPLLVYSWTPARLADLPAQVQARPIPESLRLRFGGAKP